MLQAVEVPCKSLGAKRVLELILEQIETIWALKSDVFGLTSRPVDWIRKPRVPFPILRHSEHLVQGLSNLAERYNYLKNFQKPWRSFCHLIRFVRVSGGRTPASAFFKAPRDFKYASYSENFWASVVNLLVAVFSNSSRPFLLIPLPEVKSPGLSQPHIIIC